MPTHTVQLTTIATNASTLLVAKVVTAPQDDDA